MQDADDVDACGFDVEVQHMRSGHVFAKFWLTHTRQSRKTRVCINHLK